MKKLILIGLGILVLGGFFLLIPQNEMKTSERAVSVENKIEVRSPAKESSQMSYLKSAPGNTPKISPEIEKAVNEAVNEVLGPPVDNIEQFQETERLPLADI